MGTNEPEILRSIEDRHKAFVRFINTTPYPIDVLWINYHGQAVRYSILQPLGTLDINTFATHPWIFVEHETRDSVLNYYYFSLICILFFYFIFFRFIAEGKDVFFPQPWFTRYLGMSRDQLPEHISRVEVHITLPIYSLRDISLRAIKRLLRHDLHAFSLDIPKSLQCELASMLPRKDTSGDT
ncbi:GSCOCG00001808001-RA-CDS [Cotesia congregata]|nr:GSCOCG00001808001-RA-CDS [Cotesia congregata]